MNIDSSSAGSAIEQEWKRIDSLLATKSDAASALALIEAQKIFIQVLDIVSYGSTVEEKIHNAESLFGDISGIVKVQELYTRVVAEVGYVASSSETKKACEVLLAGIIDLTGRDWEPKSLTGRVLNSMNYFWGHHPKFVTGIALVVLGFVAIVWFLADTNVGQWLSKLSIGFARFVIERPFIMIGLVVILGIGWVARWAFGAKR